MITIKTGILEGTNRIIIATVTSFVGLLIIIFGYYLWRKRKEFLNLLSETELKRLDDKNRSLCLKELPLHKAFYDYSIDKNLFSTDDILSLIEKNQDTMNKLDYDNKCAFDIAIESNFSSSIIIYLLMINLPFKIDHNNEITLVDPVNHNYAWIKTVGPTDDNSEIVSHVLKECPLLIDKLAYACDDKNRTAIEVFLYIL